MRRTRTCLRFLALHWMIRLVADETKPTLGEVRPYAGQTPPSGWMLCHGQTLEAGDHRTLYHLLTQYSAHDSGRHMEFQLPNLQARFALMPDPEWLYSAGSATVTLSEEQMPVHRHTRSTYLRTTDRSPRWATFSAESEDDELKVVREWVPLYPDADEGRWQRATRQHATVSRAQLHHLRRRRGAAAPEVTAASPRWPRSHCLTQPLRWHPLRCHLHGLRPL